MVKKFSRAELKKFDCRNGTSAYVVYKNKVYELAQGKLWKQGIHADIHRAGNDLRESSLNARTAKSFLKNFLLSANKKPIYYR